MEYNIIGDVAGRYYELLELVAKMPADAHIILVGDLMDRGPKSKQVIQWAIDNKDRVTCLYGNHEDMMVQACSGKMTGLDNWLWNGGGKTLLSYDVNEEFTAEQAINQIPASHVEFLKSLPRYFLVDGLLVTHAPYRSDLELSDIEGNSKDYNFNWERGDPSYRPGVFQVYGHNARLKKHELTGVDEDFKPLWYAMCIDNSSRRQLMGIHWPSKELYTVDYTEWDRY